MTRIFKILSRTSPLLAGAFALLITQGCSSVGGATVWEGLSPEVRRGEGIARSNCATCHAIGADTDSPDPMAPAFQRIRLRYNRLSLEREFQTITEVGHYLMKPTPIEGGDVQDLIAYIESLD